MARRVKLPGADELFRATGQPDDTGTPQAQSADTPTPEAPQSGEGQPESTPRPRGSGRVKHDEKMTVYVTADELLEIEQARLKLRRSLGQGVDRGRLVREAIALALADLEEHGDDSDLARRLRSP